MKKHYSFAELPQKICSAMFMFALLAVSGTVKAADNAPYGVTLTPATEKSAVVQKIPAGTKKGDVITFPAFQIPENSAVILKVNMRLAGQRPAGWGHHAAIHVNNRNLGEFTPDKERRLLGRAKAMQTSHPKEKSVNYFRSNTSYGYILLLTGVENSDAVDYRLVSPKTAVYEYYFDITDMVKNNSVTTVQFTNHLPERYKLPMLVKDVQLFTAPADKLPQLRGTASAAAQASKDAVYTPATDKLSVVQKIPAGTSKGSIITVPAIQVPEGMSVVLRFNMRLIAPAPSGWAHYASLHLNNRNVTALTPQKLPRMLERGSAMQTTHPKDKSVPWFRANSTYGYMLTLFGPEKSEKVDGRITFPAKAGYVYNLDVTDLVKSDSDNTLQFTNHLPKRFGNELLIKDVQFFLVPAGKMPELRGVAAPAAKAELNAPMTPAT